MRPIKLIVEGFTSFRTKQELDFRDLDLFAITGATGAGKSSLLDAITYALYGKVARQSTINELVSQGAKSLKVEFQFQVRQTEYKVIRTWRNRGKTSERKLLIDRFEEGKWERCDRSVKIEDIVSMDFDTFTRVILLPQGQFDEFLKGNAKQRREMLRKLGGLNIFEEMRKQASDRVKDYQVKLAEIKGTIEGLQVPTDEEITAKKNELKTLEVNLPQLKKNYTNAQKLLEDETRLFDQIKRLQNLERDLGKINAKNAEIARIKQQLKQAQAASQLQPDWLQIQAIRNRVTEAENHLQSAANQFNQAKTKLDIQQENYDRIQAEADEIETQLEKRGQDLAIAQAYNEQYQQTEREVNQADKKLKQKSQQYQDREVEVNKAREAVTNAQKQLETVNLTLAQTSAGGSRLEVLDRVIPLIPQWKTIVEQKKRDQKNLDKTVKEKQQQQSEHTSCLNQLETSNVKLKEAEAALKEAQLNNDKIDRQNHAAVLRASLHSGDDCPVCGGKYPEAHLLPSLPDAEIIPLEPLEKSFQNAQRVYQQTQTSLTQIETRLESLQQQETDFQQDLETSQRQLTESQNQISTILDAEEWDAKTLKQEQQQLFKQNENYKQSLAKKQKFEAELARLEQSLQFSSTNLGTAQKELQIAKEEVDRRQKQFQEIRDKLYLITKEKSYDNLKQQLEQDKRDWEEKKRESKTKYQETHSQFTKAETIYKTTEKEAHLARNQKEQLETQWQTKLSDRSFTEASFEKAQATETERQEWQEAIESHERKKIEVSSRIQEIKDTIGDRTTDETAVTNRREAKKRAEEQLNKSQKQQTELELWLKNTDSKQQQNKELLECHEQVQQQEQVYQTLARDLQSDKFQAYILEHLERDLVSRATVLLKDLTDSRYALRIKDGDYYVEDNWNGGEMRRVRTLSGGETFATSLSMALALSEKLSMGADLGCLFLDEGFGTLDRETLESVTHILDSLRQQDRLIGVITHIPALAEQFTQIKVHKSQQGSNLVIEPC